MKEYLAQDQAEPPLPEGHPAVPCATPADRNHDGGHRSFHLELHKRCQEAHLTYIAMERLSFNEVWHLVGATVCPSKLGIGPLERSCQEGLSNLTDRQVTSLVPGNSSHFCYGNSLIHAYLGRVPQAVMPLCPPDAAVRAALQKVLSSAGRTTRTHTHTHTHTRTHTHTHTPVDAIRMEISHP